MKNMGPMWKFYIQRLWLERASLVPAIFFAALFAGSQAMIAKIGGKFAGKLTDPAFLREIWESASTQKLLGGLALLLFAMAIFEFVHKYLIRKSLELMIQKLRTQIFAKYLSFSEAIKARYNTGTAIHHLISDVQLIGEARNLITELIKEPMVILALLGTLFAINWKLCLLCIVAGVPIGLVSNMVGNSARRNQMRAQERLAETISHTNENFQGMRTVHSLLMEKEVNKSFIGLMKTFTITQLKLTWLEESIGPIIKVFSVLIGCLIFYVGGRFAFVGKSINVEELSSFVIAAGLLPVPLRNFTHAGVHVQRISAGAKRIYDLFNVEFDALSNDQQKLLHLEKTYAVPTHPETLEFRSVDFSYLGSTEEKPVIRNLSFSLEPGKKIALVGRSGAGKSTLALLAMRFIDPVSGSVILGGKNAKAWELGEFRSFFSYVSQEVYFFQGSIRENLTRAAPLATEEMMWSALELAQIKSRIQLLPHKLDSLLTEKAANLSGGEKQRLAIARALLRSAPILVLDEATSNLDSENEHLIQKGLENLVKNRSTIVIAHRLSTVMSCDEVIVMERGEILERGNPKELRERNSQFAHMWDIQQGEA
jgi:subfamily B ATP-binding cassette protein MsbA